MAATARQSAVAADSFTPEEQAQFDQMRDADAAAPVEETTPPPVDEGSAPEADAGVDPAAGDGRQKTVPHAALHEERERRKSVETLLAEERKARQVGEERLNMLLQRFAQPQPAPVAPQPVAPTSPLPDMEKDPLGFIIAKFNQQNTQLTQQSEVLNSVVQAIQQQGQQSQQQQQANTVMQHAMALERQFANTTPDYQQAVAYLADQRHRELEAAGYRDIGQRQQVISQEAQEIARGAIQRGENPAEVVYKLSKIRGFTAPAAAAANGGDQQAAPTEAERLAQVQRGQQQAGRSVGAMRGSGPPTWTVQSVIGMSDQEFAAFLDKATPEQMRSVMGE